MTEKWQRFETEMLISVFKNYPLLYDSRHEDYGKPLKKLAAFKEIVTELSEIKSDLTIQMVRQKIKILRQQLLSEKKRRMKNGESNEFVPTLWCYNHLSFLQPYVSEPKSTDMLDTRDDLNNINDTITKKPKYTHNNGNINNNNNNNNNSSNKRYEKIFNRAETSLDLLHDLMKDVLSEKTKSKAQLFSEYICSEMEELNETYDETKQQIIHIIMNAKSKEKALQLFTNNVNNILSTK